MQAADHGTACNTLPDKFLDMFIGDNIGGMKLMEQRSDTFGLISKKGFRRFIIEPFKMQYDYKFKNKTADYGKIPL